MSEKTNRTITDEKSLDYSSVQKTLKILMMFIPDNKELGVLEISRALQLNKSTVSRLIRVLHHYEFVQQNGETKKYSLGKTSASIGSSIDFYQADQLKTISQAYIEELRDAVRESVSIEILTGGYTQIISEAMGPPPLSVSFENRLPFHVAAGAKSILAYSDPQLIENYSKRELAGMTKNTITSSASLLKELKKIKKEGIAHDCGEANLDVFAIGTPVFNYRKLPIAAVCICVPSTRQNVIDDPDVVQRLKDTATRISEKLFFKDGE